MFCFCGSDSGVEGMRKSENSVWMDEVLLRSVSVCHPQVSEFKLL